MQTRVGAYGVIVRGGMILLTYWAEGQRWSLPGGGIEWGEDPEVAALREIFEETGFTARLDRALGANSIVIEAAARPYGVDEPLHSIRIVYEASIVSGTLTNESSGSSTEARWFGLDEVTAIPRVDVVDFGLARWREARA